MPCNESNGDYGGGRRRGDTDDVTSIAGHGHSVNGDSAKMTVVMASDGSLPELFAKAIVHHCRKQWFGGSAIIPLPYTLCPVGLTSGCW